MIDPDQVQEAIEIAAGYRLGSGATMTERSNASPHAVAVTKRVIMRFLENIDDDAMVAEILEAMGATPATEDEGDD